MLVAQSCLTFCTPWTVAHQAPLSIGFCRQEYWSGLPFSSLGDLPDPGIKPGSPALHADYLSSEPPGKRDEPNRGFRKADEIMNVKAKPHGPPYFFPVGAERKLRDKKSS